MKAISKWFIVSLVISLLSTIAFAQSADVFKAAMTTNVVTMDAHLSTNTAVRQVAIYIFESLVCMGENYEIIPQLAENWEISDDRLTYTFRLRENVKFHNGKTLDANDIKASVERYRMASHGGERFSAIESVEVIDPLTVRFCLSETVPFLTVLANPNPLLAIYPAEIVEKYGHDEIRGADIIGTGPYKFIDWRPDVHVRLGRFEDYVADERFEGSAGFGGRRDAFYKEIQLIPVPETSARLAGLETGEFDFAESVPIVAHERLDENADLDVAIIKPRWAVVLELNQGEPPMDDLRFRRALVAALDMEEVMKAVTFGRSPYYRVQPSIFFPEQADWFTEAGGEIYNNQDLELTRRLLGEVGYNNEPIVFLCNRDFEWMYKATLALASQWQRAGINIQLEFLDWPSQIQKAESLEHWHINQTGWSPRFDPTQLLNSLHSNSVGAYNYKNPEMDALLYQVNMGLPLEERRAVWEQIQRLVWEDVAIIRVGDYFELDAIRSDVEGYQPFYVTPRFWNVHPK